uniref:HCLS1-associated protein X-1-like n=1 Tax=Crassostrea virginica TaxID=6565 RepID=A0A8B8DNL8_CRAVI|nr:HCLS1-associated protein X-1-like [Crassostrea virginica]
MGIGDLFHDFFFVLKRHSNVNDDHGKPHIPNIDCEDEDFIGIADESFNDVQKHMEMIQREMETIFRSFGGMHMPFESIPGGREERRGDNPRDFMLKEPDSSQENQITPMPPSHRGFHHFFEDFVHKFGPQEPIIKEDKDLDSEGKDIDLGRVFADPGSRLVPSPAQRGGFFSRGSSVSVTTIRGADGRIEEKRTVRDSSGREETTVTRTIGDKSHSVTTRVDPSGIPETTETFTNVDEDDKKGFDNKWKRPSGNPVQPLTLLPENPPLTPDQHPGGSLLDRIFGLKLFGPKDDQ